MFLHIVTFHSIVFLYSISLTKGTCPEKCIARQSFHHCANTTQCIYSDLDDMVYYASKLYDTVFGNTISQWLKIKKRIAAQAFLFSAAGGNMVVSSFHVLTNSVKWMFNSFPHFSIENFIFNLNAYILNTTPLSVVHRNMFNPNCILFCHYPYYYPYILIMVFPLDLSFFCFF